MPNLMVMQQDHTAAVRKAEAIVAASEREGRREFTQGEAAEFDAAMSEVNALGPQIADIKRRNTLAAQFPRGIFAPLPDTSALDAGYHTPKPATPGQRQGRNRVLGAAYMDNFYAYLASNGLNGKAEAALYEGSNPAGGFAVPVEVDGQIIALAPQETGVRSVAKVIATNHDVRLPRKASNGVAAAKAESGTTLNYFSMTSPTLDEITLAAYMAGAAEDISFELAQDVPIMQGFVIDDLLNAQQQYEEGKYIFGSGQNEPQGLIGNVGAGVTEGPDALGNLVGIDATLDLIGTLRAAYQTGASFLMNRLTSIGIRKAQRQANIFEPVFTRSGDTDYLHGYPIVYSAQMPTAAKGSTPILFGDFAEGFLIGDRGGSGINVKILDQPKALAGLITLLAYRRTDSRVRRPEAIQSFTCA